jgi:rhodanese-related sulfurtransferase
MSHASGFLALVAEVMPRITEVSVAELVQRMQQGSVAHLIDVREDNEWAAGSIPGAQHIGRGVLERDIEQVVPAKDAAIVLYCGGGYRSALAADSLQKMGYSQVFSLAGGWKAWNAEVRA